MLLQLYIFCTTNKPIIAVVFSSGCLHKLYYLIWFAVIFAILKYHHCKTRSVGCYNISCFRKSWPTIKVYKCQAAKPFVFLCTETRLSAFRCGIVYVNSKGLKHQIGTISNCPTEIWISPHTHTALKGSFGWTFWPKRQLKTCNPPPVPISNAAFDRRMQKQRCCLPESTAQVQH